MSYQAIKANRDVGGVATMCRALGVSVSGYYAWLNRQPSARQQQDQTLVQQIRVVHQESRRLYGSPRIHARLQQKGLCCSRKRVARLMKQHGIHSRRRPKRRMNTTDSDHNRPVAPNLLQREFSATAANQKWVGDILAIWTTEGWLYLAALLDIYSRMVVGWAMSAQRDEALVANALQMALHRRGITAENDLLHHTDRGSQYTANDYLAQLQSRNIQVSMSGKGNPYDNALMESFFSTLRAELTELEDFATRAAGRLAVFDYIEVFYNRQRIHSSLGYHSPAVFEANHST